MSKQANQPQNPPASQSDSDTPRNDDDRRDDSEQSIGASTDTATNPVLKNK
ncbi:MAG TPA: hypothetical protein VJ727_04595 [Rhodanobacteraceae bacterium]|nr:hypothetical protein [Rhodanobacteraceae bacterium]